MKTKKLLSILLLVLLLASFPYAKTEKPILHYTHISKINVSFSISNGSAKYSGVVFSKKSDTICSITLKLQRNVSGTWKTVTSWTDSTKNSGFALVSGSKDVESGYTYRAVVYATVKSLNGEVLETGKVVSNYVAY